MAFQCPGHICWSNEYGYLCQLNYGLFVLNHKSILPNLHVHSRFERVGHFAVARGRLCLLGAQRVSSPGSCWAGGGGGWRGKHGANQKTAMSHCSAQPVSIHKQQRSVSGLLRSDSNICLPVESYGSNCLYLSACLLHMNCIRVIPFFSPYPADVLLRPCKWSSTNIK